MWTNLLRLILLVMTAAAIRLGVAVELMDTDTDAGKGEDGTGAAAKKAKDLGEVQGGAGGLSAAVADEEGVAVESTLPEQAVEAAEGVTSVRSWPGHLSAGCGRSCGRRLAPPQRPQAPMPDGESDGAAGGQSGKQLGASTQIVKTAPSRPRRTPTGPSSARAMWLGIVSIKGDGLPSVGQSERAACVAVLFISTLENNKLNTNSRLRPSAASDEVLLQELVSGMFIGLRSVTGGYGMIRVALAEQQFTEHCRGR